MDIRVRCRELAHYFSRKLPSIIAGAMAGNAVYTHWGKDLRNFGDCLQPVLLKHYGFTPVYSQYADADIVMVGSILQWIPPSFSGVILGTGGEDMPYSFPAATVAGVRGKLTLRNLGLSDEQNVTLGDPGLLLSYVFPETLQPKWLLGIVPHFVDKGHAIIRTWQNQFGDSATVIDVLQHPRRVVAKIKQCRHIVSSSLHGLVVADSFGIPNVRFAIRENIPATPAYEFKYADYYSAFDMGLDTVEANGGESVSELISRTTLKSERISPVKTQLHEVCSKLKVILDEHAQKMAGA